MSISKEAADEARAAAMGRSAGTKRKTTKGASEDAADAARDAGKRKTTKGAGAGKDKGGKEKRTTQAQGRDLA